MIAMCSVISASHALDRHPNLVWFRTRIGSTATEVLYADLYPCGSTGVVCTERVLPSWRVR